MFVKRKTLFILLIAVIVMSFSACSNIGADNKKQGVTRTNFQLNTAISVTIYDEISKDTIFTDIFNEIGRLESILSVDYPGSELELIYKNAGIKPVEVSKETLEVLKKSISYSELSGGLFDVTTGPLISLWDITGKGHYPSKAELEQTIPLTDYRKIIIEGNTVMLSDQNMKVNLGAIAKGYIADCIKTLMLEKGIKHAIINLGGNIVTIGGKPDGTDFVVGIQDPEKDTGSYIGTISVKDSSLVSSGTYERFFTYEGKRYHHIINPKTGFPEENGLVEVTILSEKSIDGDGLSTTTFLLGPEKGIELLEQLPGIEGIFITKEHEIYITEGLEDKLSITNPLYKIVRRGVDN